LRWANAGIAKVEQKHRAPKRVIAPKRPATKKVENPSNSMSTDELWALHEKIAATLTAKITAEIEVLEGRLRLLIQGLGVANAGRSQETTALDDGAARAGETD
jgi:hypothetical protein